MIDPKTFIKTPPQSENSLKHMDGAFQCSEQGCFITVHEALYDSENSKAYWKCDEGHESSAVIIYE